ncbi:peptidyl-prolyl cis-trans isomerase (rotamase)-cyclophilin family [groundwater metagenome]
MKIKNIVIVLILLVSITLGCIGSKPQSDTTTSGGTGKNRVATIVTEKGTIKFELYEKEAPITTKNFIELAQSGFYDGLTFHRVEPGFVIQGGDPKGDGTGGSEKTIPLEIAPSLSHRKGAVGMARSNDPNSASSQFYICLEDAKFLDKSYAVFGQVIEGQDVMEKIAITEFTRFNDDTLSETSLPDSPFQAYYGFL